MGFLRNVGVFFGVADDEYDEYEDNWPYGDESQSANYVEEIKTLPKGNVRALKRNQRNEPRVAGPDMIVLVSEPTSYDEAPTFVDGLKQGKVIVVNFEKLDKDTKRQIFDFINGGIYSMGGNVQKVTKEIFIFAPRNVEIEGLKDELNKRGVFPW